MNANSVQNTSSNFRELGSWEAWGGPEGILLNSFGKTRLPRWLLSLDTELSVTQEITQLQGRVSAQPAAALGYREAHAADQGHHLARMQTRVIASSNRFFWLLLADQLGNISPVGYVLVQSSYWNLIAAGTVGSWYRSKVLPLRESQILLAPISKPDKNLDNESHCYWAGTIFS